MLQFLCDYRRVLRRCPYWLCNDLGNLRGGNFAMHVSAKAEQVNGPLGKPNWNAMRKNTRIIKPNLLNQERILNHDKVTRFARTALDFGGGSGAWRCRICRSVSAIGVKG